MKLAGGAFVFVLLLVSPALAQREPEPPPPVPPVEEPSEEGTEGVEATDGVAPDDTDTQPSEAPLAETEPDPSPPRTSQPAAPPERAREPAPPSSSGSAGTPGQPAPPPAVIVRHHGDDDDADEEEEPAADPGDPYDIIWIELFGGASYTDLRAIRQTDYFPEIVRLAGWGPAGGAAVGFRVEFFSAGIRAALARYDVSDAMHPDAIFDVGTATIEAKLALPIPVVQPFVRVGFGLAWHGDSNVEDAWEMGEPPSNFETTVFGWVFQGAVGLDIYLVHWFAIGAAFSIDLLNMSRQPIEEANDVTLAESGDAVGVQARGHGAVSFHF